MYGKREIRASVITMNEPNDSAPQRVILGGKAYPLGPSGMELTVLKMLDRATPEQVTSLISELRNQYCEYCGFLHPLAGSCTCREQMTEEI